MILCTFAFKIKPNNMKAILFIAATLFVNCLALNADPLDVVPYCRTVENGFTTDANGELFVLSEYLCDDGIGFAIFHNGQNSGFNLTYIDVNGFWSINGNDSLNQLPPLGVLYDIGSDYCNDGIGIKDGTYDTVDGAMSINFDGQAYGGAQDSNITTTCSSSTVSFTLDSDVLPKGLVTKRTFYFPKASSEAWGRVVDEVHNPTNANIQVSVSYYNNLGSDDSTHFFNLTDRYSFTSETDNITALPEGYDNLVSFHWATANASLPNGFISYNQFDNGTLLPPLSEGNDDIVPYWNVTIPAGKTMTFMMIMNQGGWDVDKMHLSVKDIDANPLKLYVDMTADQLTTLHNFNPCVATVPQLSTNVTPKTACSSFGGNAEFDLTSYISALEWTPNVNISITAHGSDGNTVTLNKDNMIVVPSGTYDIKLTFAQCGINIGQVTVTCPDAPVTAPVSQTTSSASSLILSGLVALTSVVLFFL